MQSETWVPLLTLVRKEIMRFFRIWSQTLLPAPMSMALYLLIFGDWLGKRIGVVQGVSYLEFIAPGLILMSVITNSYANVVSSFFGSKFQRNIQELYVAPMSSFQILCGFLAGGVLRGIIIAGAVSFTSWLLAGCMIVRPVLACFVIFLTALLFSTAGIINGIFAKKFDDTSFMQVFVLTPLTYLGGVFYSVSMLPPFWKKLAAFNPIFYMVDLLRYSMIGVSEGEWFFSLMTILGLTIILLGLAWRYIDKGIGVKV